MAEINKNKEKAPAMEIVRGKEIRHFVVGLKIKGPVKSGVHKKKMM
jgi:hypothetical protein